MEGLAKQRPCKGVESKLGHIEERKGASTTGTRENREECEREGGEVMGKLLGLSEASSPSSKMETIINCCLI